MKLNQILQAAEETQFLKQLSSLSRLFLVGDRETLEYLKQLFQHYQSENSNFYYDCASQPLEGLSRTNDISSYQAIVVVSLQDELALSVKVEQQLESTPHPVILKLFADIFVNRLSNCPLLNPVPRQHQKPKISYAILTTPRSGSTYFCDLLDSTGIAGHPMEHLRLATQELSLYCNFDYLHLLDSLMEHRTTSNSVFGTKVISHFLFELKKAKPKFWRIFRAIDKFILLVRKDKVAQAVSLVLAQRTEVWHIHQNEKQVSYQSQLDSIEINESLLDDVARKVRFINQQEERLKKILADNKIEPLMVVYEDILENAPVQIDRILDFLSIAKPSGQTLQIGSSIKRMPSDISRKIMDRYRARERVARL